MKFDIIKKHDKRLLVLIIISIAHMGQLFIEKLSRVSEQQIILQVINQYTFIVYIQLFLGGKTFS